MAIDPVLVATAPICVEISPYQVRIPGRVAARAGALLKVGFGNDSNGFADLMAWPELGDLSLSEELIRIREKSPTALGKQVLINAFKDAQGRELNQSLWTSDLKLPPSHYLIGTTGELEMFFKNGASLRENQMTYEAPTLKIKWNKNFRPSFLASLDCQWRIDFNEHGSPEVIQEILAFPELKARIDFLEDPFSAENIDDWKWLKQSYPEVRVFGDYATERNPALIEFCDGLVLKPASRPFEKILGYGKALCVTHSLGHPLGQMTAAWHAAKIAGSYPSVSVGFLPGPRLDAGLANPSIFTWNYSSFPEGQGYGIETSELLGMAWRIL